MKSFIFSTDNERGGVMLCDIETLEDAVEYLNKRFPGVVKVEMGKDYWTTDEGFHKAQLIAGDG
ncbi:hypothetical protein A9R01_04030 ['Osedax' symbiont bacterium Rs2_46_30_T18]|nr:hypothetical protein A9R01_04030 ['Osedax' symbiont bacterium Rs2_46_30_T18]